jgi:Fe-S cluster assembly protein SufD
VRSGASSRAGVVEIVVDVDAGLLAALPSPSSPTSVTGGAGGLGHLVVPLTEIDVADDATLSFVSVQSLGTDTWQLAHQGSTIGANATLQSFAVALGGDYARLRTDSALRGESGTSLLRAAFIGRDDQMLDFRTLQDHLAPRTTSDLLFMGAVADHAHSVYSGLIRVRRGAVRSDAMQTNHNLVLDEGAHADSVPNLDIEENDVKCSHGSTVGPVDEDQRYYLESRGVEPEVAERLIVAGFFEAIADQVPIDGTRSMVGRALADRTGVTGA